jgi:septum formation protein
LADPTVPLAPLILASASPRRRQLLQDAGLDFAVDVSTFEEDRVRHLPPRRQALAAARGKALEVLPRHPGAWIVGADTVVVLDGVALGKPCNPQEAELMLRSLSNRDHHVHSAVCVVAPDGRRATALASSQVRLAPLTPSQVRAYVAGGEALGKAGAYAIQGQAGEFTRLVRGRRDTVVGLSLKLLARLLRRLDHPAARSLSDNLDPS